MPEIIFDSCVLSNFALSGSFSIIKRLYQNHSYITSFASAEIMRGIQGGHSSLRIIQKAMRDGWLKEVAIESKKERTLFELLSVSLGLGEASSIAVARSRGLLFASDDRVARREANLLGIKLTGTLGILKRAIIRKLISQKKADLILKSMIEHGFHSPIRTLKDID